MFPISHRLLARLALIGMFALAAGVAHAQSHDHDDHDHHDDHGEEGVVEIHPSAAEAFGVRVEPVARRTLAPTFPAPARLVFNSERMAHIGSAVVGRVAEMPVRLGDQAREGDALLVLESPELGAAQSEYIQSRAIAAAAAPLVELARSSYDRGRKLYEETQGISLTEVQNRMAALQGAESTLLNARAAMMGAANRLMLLGMSEDEIESMAASGEISPRVTLRAPIGGRVVRRDVTLGELVRPEQDALLVVADTETLWAIVDVPETRLGAVGVGSVARLRFVAFPDEVFEGPVQFISADLNEATRTARVRVELENKEGRLRPGMFAQAELSAGSAPVGAVQVLAVPDAAVQTIEGQTVVFVRDPERYDLYEVRPVVVGEPIGGMRQVFEGLAEGDPIVVASSFILKAQLGKSTAKHEH